MKRVIFILCLGIFLMSFAAAASGDMPRDGTGVYHDEVVAAGGQGGDSEPALMQERIENTIQARKQIRTGDFEIKGKNVRIDQRENNKIRLRANDVSAESALEFEEEVTDTGAKIKTKLSNGRKAEIKVMPDTASATALQRLRLRNCIAEEGCTMELKEVGEGEQVRAAYEIKAQKQAKVFGLFRARMNLESQIDAETGEVIRAKRPWWSFLATEEEAEEIQEEIIEEEVEVLPEDME